MSIFSQIEKSSDIDSKIANSLEKLVNGILNITEFNQNELKAISVLLTDYRIREYLFPLLQNKKHIKRKHAVELQNSLKLISNAILNNNNGSVIPNDEISHRFFGRRD